uniref:Uncharacterized protein n=1 Tax=Oryza nivara TaxID=4536 RepID=A0A0E0H526_ORYNI
MNSIVCRNFRLALHYPTTYLSTTRRPSDFVNLKLCCPSLPEILIGVECVYVASESLVNVSSYPAADVFVLESLRRSPSVDTGTGRPPPAGGVP